MPVFLYKYGRWVIWPVIAYVSIVHALIYPLKIHNEFLKSSAEIGIPLFIPSLIYIVVDGFLILKLLIQKLRRIAIPL